MVNLWSYISPTFCWRELKKCEGKNAQKIVQLVKTIRCFDLPSPRWLYRPIYCGWKSLTSMVDFVIRVFWWTPLFKSACSQVGERLYLYGGMPWIAGPLVIKMGDDCRLSGKVTLTGRPSSTKPTLELGNNVGVGWQVTIAVGTDVRMGNNVRVANQCFLAGYPGHPIDAESRAMHKADLPEQAKSIYLEDDVWIGTGSTVLAGVRIGKGTIVGAGSVVTKSMPSGVIVAGNPARVIRRIGDQ